MAEIEDLRGMYESFCSFGSSRNLASPHSSMESIAGPQMDGAKFAKFCRDNRIIDNKKVHSTDVDIIFNKVKPKGARKLDWNTFQDALQLVAEKKHGKKGEGAYAALVTEIVRKGKGPVVSGTVPQQDAILDRMTDTSLYTGTHKLRFDEEGRGRGAEGRDQPSKTDDLSKITNREETSVRGLPVSADPFAQTQQPRTSTGKRGHQNVVTASSERLDLVANKPKKTTTTTGTTSTRASATDLSKKPTTAKKTYNATQDSSNVFDRLTNTKDYTGAHKHRFNADGSGRGLAGRDAPAKGAAPGTYRGGDVKDLSQILRS